MDGDYLFFWAFVDGKLTKCCVTFDALSLRSNNAETIKVVFWRKKEQLYATARALIEADQFTDGEILITSLNPLPPHVEFPDVAPAILADINALTFPAIMGGKTITCVVSFEVLMGQRSNDADAAIGVYQTQKADLQERGRALIAAGRVDADRELMITQMVRGRNGIGASS